MTQRSKSASDWRVAIPSTRAMVLEELEPEQLTSLLDALFAELSRRWREALAMGETVPGWGKVPG